MSKTVTAILIPHNSDEPIATIKIVVDRDSLPEYNKYGFAHHVLDELGEYESAPIADHPEKEERGWKNGGFGSRYGGRHNERASILLSDDKEVMRRFEGY